MENDDYIKSIFRYDAESGNLIRTVNGIERIAGTPINHSENAYLVVSVRNKCYLAHRIAFFLMTGRWPQNDIDHINGIRSDNRWRNLRAATRAQNLWNRKAGHNKSGFKGVSIHRDINRKKRFGASITTHYKTLFLGWFATAEEAANAYRTAAIDIHGDFARC